MSHFKDINSSKKKNEDTSPSKSHQFSWCKKPSQSKAPPISVTTSSASTSRNAASTSVSVNNAVLVPVVQNQASGLHNQVITGNNQFPRLFSLLKNNQSVSSHGVNSRTSVLHNVGARVNIQNDVVKNTEQNKSSSLSKLIRR